MMLGTTAQAQDVPYPPLVSDQLPGYEFADGRPVDIMGISLGMPREEALAKARASYPGLPFNPDERIMSVGDGRGNDVAVRYYANDQAYSDFEDRRVSFSLYYTTGISGARVTRVRRSEEFRGAQPEMSAFVDALKAKYGPPSYEGPGLFRWAWLDGRLAAPDLDWNRDTCDGYEEFWVYTFSDPRYDVRSPCAAILEVSIRAGARDDLIGKLGMVLSGLQRQYDNEIATDSWISEEIARLQASKAPGAAPAL